MRSLAKQRAWPALAYDGSKQLFAPSRAIEEAHRKDGITIPVHRPADLEGGDPEDVFKVRPGKPRSSVRLSRGFGPSEASSSIRSIEPSDLE